MWRWHNRLHPLHEGCNRLWLSLIHSRSVGSLLLSLGIDYRPGMMVGNSEPLLLSVPLIFFFGVWKSLGQLKHLFFLRLKWNSEYIPLRKTGREKELMSDIKQGSLMVNHIPPEEDAPDSIPRHVYRALSRIFSCLPSSLLVSSWNSTHLVRRTDRRGYRTPDFFIFFLIGLGRI